MRNKKIFALGAAAVLLLSGCTGETGTASDQASKTVNSKAAGRTPYLPKNDVEFNNYNRAQELADDPNSILWCTTTWGNPSAPLVTVPIAGKMTSSSVSFFPGSKVDYDQYGNIAIEQRSVDGMYHGNPPPYRFGFTPGGQYVEAQNMPMFCTTALTSFQRESTDVSITVDQSAEVSQAAAEAALKSGDPAAAQQALEALESTAGDN